MRGTQVVAVQDGVTVGQRTFRHAGTGEEFEVYAAGLELESRTYRSLTKALLALESGCSDYEDGYERVKTLHRECLRSSLAYKGKLRDVSAFLEPSGFAALFEDRWDELEAAAKSVIEVRLQQTASKEEAKATEGA